MFTCDCGFLRVLFLRLQQRVHCFLHKRLDTLLGGRRGVRRWTWKLEHLLDEEGVVGAEQRQRRRGQSQRLYDPEQRHRGGRLLPVTYVHHLNGVNKLIADFVLCRKRSSQEGARTPCRRENCENGCLLL